MTWRRLCDPFVVAPPAAVSVRTSLHVDADEHEVLWQAGSGLGSLLRKALSVRCVAGPGNKHLGRTEMKRSLTEHCSSRQAGTITRVAADMWERGMKNLEDLRDRDRREIDVISKRLALEVASPPKGAKPRSKKLRGFASQDERYQKQRRLQKLRSRVSRTEQRIAEGRPSIVVGGKRLARARHNLDDAGLTEQQWRLVWDSMRLFLRADGESGKIGGNETIRVMPASGSDDCELTIRLPASLAHLSNTPGRAPTFKLSSPLRWNHRANQWRQRVIAREPVSYAIMFDPDKERWYITASWTMQPTGEPLSVEQIAASGRCVAVDVNAGHIDARTLDVHGNPVGRPERFEMAQQGNSAQRLNNVRTTVNDLFAWAKGNDAAYAAIEKLDFGDIRAAGRNNRHRRGKAGRTTRRKVAGIPTAQFTHALASASHKHRMPVIAVDPAYTSIWGARYWQAPLNKSNRQKGDRHQASAVVTGRRSQGHSPKRRPVKTGHDQQPNTEDRQRRAACETKATTPDMATGKVNDERERPTSASTVRTDNQESCTGGPKPFGTPDRRTTIYQN